MSEIAMLCQTTTKEVFEKMDLSGWIAEQKKDGERIVAVKKGQDVFLLNRRGREKSWIYPEIAEELKKLDFDFVIDGEVTAEDDLFNTLQYRSNVSDRNKIRQRVTEYPLLFWVFDVIQIRDEKIPNRPLMERKQYLKGFEGLGKVKVLPYFDSENIKELWNEMVRNEKEGIVLKKKNSVYEQRRSDTWRKLKNFKEQTLKVVRFTENNAGIRCEDEELNAVQVSGTESRAVREQIQNNGFCYVCVQYLEKTKEGRLRFPSFRGISE